MFQEALDAFLVMPGWAQAGLACFVLIFVVMMVEPRITMRRARQQFGDLARARGARVTPGGDQFGESFSIEHHGRPFTVRRELRSTARGGTYRGPRGHLIVSATPLSGSLWKMHGVDIAQRGALARLGSTPLRSGDTVFDKRFTVWQDGVPVRDNWLDGPTRSAVTALFDLPAVAGGGTLWVQEGQLHYINDRPKALDHAGLTAILDRQAVLAGALEATAGWRRAAT